MAQQGNPLSDHPVFTSIAAGVGAGLFYNYATKKLLNGTPLPLALKSEFDVLSGQINVFHPKVMEDLEMKEMNETIRRYSAEENPAGIVGYTTGRIETNRQLLEEAKDIEKTIFRVRGMAGELPETQKNQFHGVIDLLFQFEQDFHAVLKIQRSTLEVVQQTYQAMTKDGLKTISVETKTRMQTLSKEYTNALLKLGNDAEVFQESAPVKNAELKQAANNVGAIVLKVVVAMFSILGAVFIAVISAVGKANQKK
jgi:hypothetical protein